MNIPIGGISFLKINKRLGNHTSLWNKNKSNYETFKSIVTDTIKSTTFAVFLIRCKDTK